MKMLKADTPRVVNILTLVLALCCLTLLIGAKSCFSRDDDDDDVIAGSSAGTGTWTLLATTNAPDPRVGHSAIWTGTEMIIWGGTDSTGTLNTGGRYNPSLNAWTATITSGAPSAMSDHVAVWTGYEMIVWGSDTDKGARYNPTLDTWQEITSGGSGIKADASAWTGTEMLLWNGPNGSGKRYDPFLDTWQTITSVNAPSSRRYYSAVWTGTELIIWGGVLNVGNAPLNTGACYNPVLNAWRPISTTGAPSGRWRHAAVWSGREMIIWGGCGGVHEEFALNTGVRYDPVLDAWAIITTTNAPSARTRHRAVWTGTEMFIWGGRNDWSEGLNTGARYDPATDTWTDVTTIGTLPGRARPSVVWTGDKTLIWGGSVGEDQYYQTGAIYDYPHTIPYWTATPIASAPDARRYHTAIWTVTTATPQGELIIWGGMNTLNKFNTGKRYKPSIDAWATISTANAPISRWAHTAVWTDTEMIVWGGFQGGSDVAPFNSCNTGARYNPVLDSWTAITDTDPDIPMGRGHHTAVWTGSEMIIWGGLSETGGTSTALDTGARYNPILDDWITITMTKAPVSRYNHTAVWTGTRMVIWGGFQGDSLSAQDTGAQYDPISDIWTTETSISGEQPSSRWSHTAVWTGKEMIIWGGHSLGGICGDGSRYDPVTNIWTRFSADAPERRLDHTAVWSGTEMIIWGGSDGPRELNDGARYLPAYNIWLTISTSDPPDGEAGAPDARGNHTAVWTGSEMIIWGGYGLAGDLNSGGRYKP